ncbi:hypothetical protein COCNU_07G010190 [Cocos nucifera]|uniref:WAT1-related protein n=1 Tax=Cocos nucifera TaxID=13894 RepID=A0A8K0N538_COCNU|nr:hypothetical protein COCNU_07G010190 [Cocos nucifera]
MFLERRGDAPPQLLVPAIGCWGVRNSTISRSLPITVTLWGVLNPVRSLAPLHIMADLQGEYKEDSLSMALVVSAEDDLLVEDIRKLRPKLTWALFLELCVLSLLGVSLSLNMYFASLKYTSPTFVSSMVNTIASMTFVIAILVRLEHLDVKSPRGMAKIVGTIVSLAGVTTMTLYKGPAVRNFWRALIPIQGNTIHEDWLKGSILTVASCITWSICIIGGLIVIIGLYLVLWGKERDQEEKMESKKASFLAYGKEEASQYENDGKGNDTERSPEV